MIGIQQEHALLELPSSDPDHEAGDQRTGDQRSGVTPPDDDAPLARSRASSALHAAAPPRGLDEAARQLALSRFDAIRRGGMTMSVGQPDARAAVLALAMSIGVAAAFGFGLGRGIGGAIAELGVRSVFDTRQPLDFGTDRNYVDLNTDRNLLQIAAIATARWLGATILGGIGATLGSVVAPRAAALTRRQLTAIAPEHLVPDHVAGLLDGNGVPYGLEGVRRLRQQILAAQSDTGQLHGRTHIRSGVVAFGAVNAARGAVQAMTPLGALPDIGISAAASLAAGAATGLAAGTWMVGARLPVPDAGHAGDGPAPLVPVPLFEVKKTAPVLPRYTGTGPRHGMGNVARGAADRIRLFVASTWLLGLLGLLVNLAGAATRPSPRNWIHRAGKAVELGVGVGAAVGPYFRGLQPVAVRDRARLEAQRARQVAPQLDLPGRMAPR